MNNGPRPPVPGLIPISALRKKSVNDYYNSHLDQDSSPQRLDSGGGGGGGGDSVVGKEVMGEQRSRRTGTQAPAPVDLIDTARSRGPSAGPQAPNRKTKSEQRHRKSEKRREHKSVRNKRSSSSSGGKQKWRSSAERPVNPRVNPIFVWVRQEDTRIVDVKCEDYDKRNRILLTKTAHGWRAIPRTETWVPTLKQSTDNDMKRARKARKSNKVKRKSTAVQVEDDIDGEESHDPTIPSSPTWTSSGDVESHLPSHTIHVNRHCSSSPEHHQVIEPSNDNLRLDATSSYPDNIQPNKMSATSPLDNLLAVAEFEFNQKIQSGEWNDTSTIDTSISSPIKEDVSEEKIPENQNTEPNPVDFLIKCDLEEKDTPKNDGQEKYYNDKRKSDEIDYDEEEENNLAMTDILDRLEQSLRTPEPISPEIPIENQCSVKESQKDDADVEQEEEEEDDKETDNCTNDIQYDIPTESEEKPQEEEEQEEATEIKEISEPESPQIEKIPEEPTDLTIRSSATCDVQEEGPKDLRTTKVLQNSVDYEKATPTDLRISTDKGFVCSSSPRPYSRSSETVQSPQPSGLPPVPPSPDVFPPFGNGKSNPKSVFLETLLSSPQKELQPQTKIEMQMEPLDLGKCRKSASPTVTCSEEVNKRTFAEADESEPKKIKVEAITLKNILSAETEKSNEKDQIKEDASGSPFLEQSKLLELLITDSEADPALQLKQLQLDPSVDLPDPLLIPKENLSQVLMSPKKEILRLLTQRPELRLPDALSFPHLLQDPNILVITLAQLQTIIQKQSQVLPPSSCEEKINKKPDNFHKTISDKKPKPKQEERSKNVKLNPLVEESSRVRCNSPNKNFSRVEETRNDMYSNESLNQMMWLPYLQQLEAAAIAFGGGSDILKGFNFPFLSLPGNQLPGMGPMIAANRFPPHPQASIPFQQHFDYNALFEYPNWQEALHQANYLRSKNQFDLNTKSMYGGHPERHHDTLKQRSHTTSQKPYSINRGYSSSINNKGNVLGNYNTSSSSREQGMRPSLQIPQYHPPNPPKNQMRKNSASFLMQPEVDSTVPPKQLIRNNYDSGHKNVFAQNMFSHHYPDASTNDKVGSHEKSLQQKMVTSYDGSRKGNSDSSMQPIDLTTSQVTSNKTRDRNHYETSKHPKHLPKQDDVPEVGSTTASLEEMTAHAQDSQKYLWHPLFGNQKPSSSSWNWATLAATGE
ncbi:uncharacterized protein LOC108737536 isoform X1 [Agrilus planipennis]|uniref:Uncharacterized protein LOC108737536 isoform X1 n=1 Tax=Agrilus planipennis TaxID=224129 RepID=A0A1W4X0K6_AGRPL|nr:uncharacterized protein LOC108737536 isoform X1 [Agrilus planipennis]